MSTDHVYACAIQSVLAAEEARLQQHRTENWSWASIPISLKP